MDPSASSDTALVKRLEALANVNRLRVLREIVVPRALREIEVPDAGAGAPLARQTVRWHLDALLSQDLAREYEVKRDYGETVEFALNHQRLFSIAEEIKALARLRPSRQPTGQTLEHPTAEPPSAAGPALLLVSGLDEGERFDLRPAPSRREWLIGRRRDADVALDFDSSVSTENAVVRWAEERHHLEDIPGSRNGTRVNFVRLGPGERRVLHHGDIIGVGRCLLVYWS